MAEVNELGRMATLAERIGPLLIARGWTLSVAESCTGGLVGHAITNISGSSDYFMGGVIAYSNDVKQRLLGVPEEMLATRGAVSREVAVAMAQGARKLIGTDAAIAVTGVAGPGGGTPAKPVGTVFIAVSSPVGELVRRYQWDADREGNKRSSAVAALELLLTQLDA